MDAEKKRKLEDSDGGHVGVDDCQKEQSLRRIISILPKEQIVEILLKAAVSNEGVAEEIHAVANKDTAQRKLFVRGLAWETTSESLLEVFAKYGDVDEGAVVQDRHTGKSRGFGFITFRDMASAHRALEEPNKKIDGRMTVCNLAAAGAVHGGGPGAPSAATASHVSDGGAHTGGSPGDITLRKLYVGGLSFDTANEAFLNLFSQYGEIEEGSIAFDRNTQKSRGFGFVTFKTVEAARKALEEPVKIIDGRKTLVKYAAEGSSKGKHFQGTSPSPALAGYGAPQQSPALFNSQAAAAAMAANSLSLLHQQAAAYNATAFAGMPGSYLGTSPGVTTPAGTAAAAAPSSFPGLAAYNSALAASYGNAPGLGTAAAGLASTLGASGQLGLPAAGQAAAPANGSGTNANAAAAAAAAAQYAAQYGLGAANPLGFSMPSGAGGLGAPTLQPSSYFSNP